LKKTPELETISLRVCTVEEDNFNCVNKPKEGDIVFHDPAGKICAHCGNEITTDESFLTFKAEPLANNKYKLIEDMPVPFLIRSVPKTPEEMAKTRAELIETLKYLKTHSILSKAKVNYLIELVEKDK